MTKSITLTQDNRRQTGNANTRSATGDAGAWTDTAALFVLAQNGDKMAYEAFLQALRPYVRTLAKRRLSRPQDIDDTVQEIFLSIHAIRHTFDPDRPLQPWINVIAERRIADRLRRLYRERARETELPEHADETFAVDDANMTTEASLDMRAVYRALEQLPPGQRQAISLVKIKGMSLRDAAAVTGQSEGAVKLSVHRAIKALRRALGGDENMGGGNG